MSDMIDRLRAISAGAGRDIAADLANPSTIDAMADRVRLGVRRRRIRLGAIGASVAVVVGAAAIAAPTLLNSLLGQPDVIQPGIVRTVGPITTYDDGSISVVLSSGEMVSVPSYEGSQEFTQSSKEALCAIASPVHPSDPWVPTTGASNAIVVKAAASVVDDSGVKTSVLPGMEIEVAAPKGNPPDVAASFEVDPAVAPFVAIKTTIVEFKVDNSMPGAPAYGNVVAASVVAGEPGPVYSGSADLGTRVGTVETWLMWGEGESGCYKYDDTLEAGYWTGKFEWYIVAEIFLVDHKGGASPLGTATYWFQADVSQ